MNKNEIMVELPNAAPGELRDFADVIAQLAHMIDHDATIWVSFPPPETELWETATEVELTGRFMGRHYAPNR